MAKTYRKIQLKVASAQNTDMGIVLKQSFNIAKKSH